MPFGVDDAIAFGAPLVGGLLGNLFNSGDRGQADQDLSQMTGLLGSVDPYSHVSTTPFTVGQTGLAGIQTDPNLRAAQMQALQSLQHEGLSGGLTAQDRARQAEAMDASAARMQGARGALQQNFAARGLGGSGMELAAQLAAQQQGAQAMNSAGMQAAGDANQRALQSIRDSGLMGQQMEQQKYGEAANAASAQDAINRFNASQRTGAQNQQNQNYFNANAQQMGKAGMYGQAAGLSQGAADRTAGFWSGLGNAAGQAATAYGYGQGSGEPQEPDTAPIKQRGYTSLAGYMPGGY